MILLKFLMNQKSLDKFPKLLHSKILEVLHIISPHIIYEMVKTELLK